MANAQSSDRLFRAIAFILAAAGSSLGCDESKPREATCPEDQVPTADGRCIRDFAPFVEIVSPRAGTSTTSATLRVEGVTSPNVEAIRFLNETNQASGERPATALWSLDVPLSPGDNRITFFADARTRTASASLFTVLSTELVFFNQPVSEPAFVVEGRPEPIRLVWGVTPARPGVVLDRVELELEDGSRPLTLVDDGVLPVDEIAQDNLFSGVLARATVEQLTNGATAPLRLRARAQYTDGDSSGELYSPPFVLDLRRSLTPANLATLSAVEASVSTLLQNLAPDGSNLGEVLTQLEEALLALPQVRSVERSRRGYSLEVQLESGFRTTIMVPVATARGGAPNGGELVTFGRSTAALQPGDPRVEARSVILLSPYLCEFGETDEGDDIAELYREQRCPQYDVEYLSNESVTIDVLRTLPRYGVVHVATHGDALNGTAWIVIREPLDVQALSRYEADLAFDPSTGAADVEPVILQDPCGDQPLRTFRINPSFFRRASRNQAFPSSLVFMSSCRSTFDGSLAAAFLGSGARSFQGFSDYVASSFAFARATAFHDDFRRSEELDTDIFTPNLTDATLLDRILSFLGLSSSTPAEWEMISSGVGGPQAGLLNGSFEEGELAGWTIEGDGRRLPGLGTASPRSGAFLGLISTGLGFTQEATIISQDICVSPGAQRLRFARNFFSEEFLEFCGSEFQDFFRVSVEQGGESFELLRQSIDDLCNQVTPTPLTFDQGDVSTTGWETFALPVPYGLDPSEPFTLQFQCGDVGDSIYDSAILLDDVRIE